MLATWCLLILCNFIWAGNSTANKILLEQNTWMQAAWLRTASSFAAYVMVVVFAYALKNERILKKMIPPFDLKSRSIKWVIWGGLLTFVGSPVLYSLALKKGKAVEATWVVAMEPVVLFLMGWWLLKEKLNRNRIIAIVLASFGFVLFARLFDLSVQVVHWPFFVMLAGAACDGLYSVVCKKGMNPWNSISVFGGTMAVGFLILSGWVLFFGTFPAFQRFELRHWLSLFWFGPLGTALTFGFWVIALEKAPVSVMTLTLYFQPLFGSLIAYGLLSETLSPIQWIGAALIVAAALLGSPKERQVQNLKKELAR